MMLSKWLGRSKQAQTINSEDLAKLHPYAALSLETLDGAASAAQRIEVNQGVITTQIPSGQAVFGTRPAPVADGHGLFIASQCKQPAGGFSVTPEFGAGQPLCK